jgi:hypothetical protein
VDRRERTVFERILHGHFAFVNMPDGQAKPTAGCGSGVQRLAELQPDCRAHSGSAR